MNKHQELAIQAIEQMMGDDLYRAKAAFSRMSAKEMEKMHGESGKTRQQILDEYQAHTAKCEAAEAWLRALSEP